MLVVASPIHLLTPIAAVRESVVRRDERLRLAQDLSEEWCQERMIVGRVMMDLRPEFFFAKVLRQYSRHSIYEARVKVSSGKASGHPGFDQSVLLEMQFQMTE